MAQDPNELDIDDYYNLSIPQRQDLDDWLTSLGGHPTITRKITLDNYSCRVEEWVVTKDKLLTYNRKAHDVDIVVREFAFEIPPPVWKKVELD